MNILITTRCNFSCGHCMFSCTKHGEDMTKDTFEKCVEQTAGIVHIFGGEPTLHPQFLEFVELAAKKKMVSITTNGSKFFTTAGATKMFKAIMALQDREDLEEIKVRLSNSEFHSKHQKFNPRFFYHRLKDHRSFELVDVQDKDLQRLGRGELIEKAHDSMCKTTDIHNWFFGPPSLAVYPNGEVAQCCEGKMIFTNINEDESVYSTYDEKAEVRRSCMSCPKYNPKYK